MGNLFDDVRDIAFDTTAQVFGKVVSWTPSAEAGGGAEQTTEIHFNDPDAVQKLGDIEYLPTQTIMEYRKPKLSGLKASVDANNTEVVVIDGNSYYVRAVKQIDDGNTLVAVLAPYTP
jgi:hypothetical protein